MTASSRTANSDRQRWLLATIGTVLWHVAVLGLLELLQPFAAGEVRASEPQPVDLVFAREVDAEDAPERSADEPDYFTELPSDRADRRPERADALSNVDSRARDRAEGETETELPRLQGEADRPSVAMQPSPSGEPQPASQAGSLDTPGEEERAGPEEWSEAEGRDPAATDTFEQERANEATVGQAEQGERALPEGPRGEGGSGRGRPPSGRQGDPREELLREPAPPRAEAPRYLVGVGREDLYQEEMNNRVGNVSLFGDVSLNTIAWDWAPWWQRFARTYHRNWFPPYAYRIGIISGRQVVDVEVGKDGTLLRLEVVEQEGHESLTESTLATFRAIAPYQPLPRDFPEETLKMRITVTYGGPRRP